MVGKTKIQKKLQLLVLEGDGIGPEICREAVKILNVLDRKYALNLEIIIENVGEYTLEFDTPIWIRSMDIRKTFDTIDHRVL